jgi:cytochrome P450
VKPVVIKEIYMAKGMLVSVDVYSIHFNPEYWGSVDPHEFYPLRHDFSIYLTTRKYLNFNFDFAFHSIDFKIQM